MAYLTRTLTGDFDQTLRNLHNGILGGSISASYEAGSDWAEGGARCALRVYERFSWAGGNRLSLTLQLCGVGENLQLTAITAGGSQAMFFKLNTIGEEAFLDKLRELLP